MSTARRPVRLGVLAAFVAATTFGPLSAPAQAQATHVAIYVAGVGTACARSGTDGLTALESRYDVTIGPPGRPTVGMVLFIDGVGSNSNKPNYWSYWHWSNGRWQYAGTGPAGYNPPAGSSEGWAFGSYGSTDQPPLPSASYASICAATDPKPPTLPPSTRPATHSSSSRASTPSAPRSNPPGSTSARTSSTGDSAANPSKPATGTTTSPPPTSPGAPSSSGAPSSPGAGATSGASVSDAVTLPAAPPKAGPTQRSGLPPWGTALALVVVAALAGVAIWRTRLQRRRLP